MHLLPELKQKEAGGRPLKFRTVEELQEKIDDYFKKTKPQDYTITGLAMHLDTFRVVLLDYEHRNDEYSDAIKKAKQKIENGYELDLKKHGRTGTIFALKNFNWKDQIQTDITTQGRPVPILYAIHSNNSPQKDPQIKEADTSDTGGNIGEQNYINPPNPDR